MFFIPGPPGWGLCVRLTTSPCGKPIVVNAEEKSSDGTIGNDLARKMEMILVCTHGV